MANAPMAAGRFATAAIIAMWLAAGRAAAAPVDARPPPARPQWAVVGHLLEPRTEAGVTALDDDRVLVCGGNGAGHQALDTCEIWSLATGRSSVAPALSRARVAPSLARLVDGSILALGGDANPSAEQPVSAELLGAGAAAWRPLAGVPRGLEGPRPIVGLADGSALIHGEDRYASSCQPAFVYDPRDDGWTEVHAGGPRVCLGAALVLPDGRIAIAGREHPATSQGPSRIVLQRRRGFSEEPADDRRVLAERPSGSLGAVLALALRADGRLSVAWDQQGSTVVATVDRTDHVDLQRGPEHAERVLARADGGLFLDASGARTIASWTSGPIARGLPAPFRLNRGAALADGANGRWLFIEVGPFTSSAAYRQPTGAVVLLADVLPPAVVARPCLGARAYLARRLGALSQGRTAEVPEWERVGDVLTGACRGAVARAAGAATDDGLGAMLAKELGFSSNSERFSVALAALAAAHPPWARAELGRAYESRRGDSDARAIALAAFVELGGDWQLALREIEQTTEGQALDDSVPGALTRSPALRAQAGPLLGAARQRHMTGFDRLRSAACAGPDSLVVAPELDRECKASVSNQERRWSASEENRSSLLLFGLQAAMAAGGATLAARFSDDDGGRVAAVGLAGWAGFSLGYTPVLSSRCEGALCGLREPVAATVGVLTGLLGTGLGALITGAHDARAPVGIGAAGLAVGMAALRLQADWQ